MKIGLIAAGIALLSMIATIGYSAEIEVKMLNKDSAGQKMVFEPSLIRANVGDTITFLPTDKGHMAASIKGMMADGGKFKGKTNKPVSYVVTAEGLYGIKCTPHMANGMVAVIAVGNTFETEAFLEGKKVSKKAKARFEDILSQL
ncbi:MAG: pseudoazurin [Paracoccaceae bacterium]|nr:pseudoazurin [Paracoccaceae bacterium]